MTVFLNFEILEARPGDDADALFRFRNCQNNNPIARSTRNKTIIPTIIPIPELDKEPLGLSGLVDEVEDGGLVGDELGGKTV
jgi:hypothetical protein